MPLRLCESTRAQQYNGKELVKATLLADVKAIQPGQKFRVGVLYRIEPSWHIYWRYSGDSGIPTKIAWQLPQGFKVGDLQWPVPMRDKEPGDLEVFDYTSEVLLFAEVEAPATLPPGPILIQAKTDWLVCQSLCVPGRAQLSLTLTGGGNVASDSAQIFQKYASLVPGQLANPIKIGFSRAGKSLVAVVGGVPTDAALDFFPIPPEDSVIGHVVRDGNKLTIPIDTEVKPINRMDGVLVVGSGETRRGYEINEKTTLSVVQPEQTGCFGRAGRSSANARICDDRRSDPERHAVRSAGYFAQDLWICLRSGYGAQKSVSTFDGLFARDHRMLRRVGGHCRSTANGRSAGGVGISIPGFSIYPFYLLPGFCFRAELIWSF